MPVHDWTEVDAGVFHDFHTVWIAQIRTALNSGLLPAGYYALAEQRAGDSIADVLALHASPADPPRLPPPPATGGLLLAETPPRVRRRETVDEAAYLRMRNLAIRHVSGHRLVAMIEIVSPANKDRLQNIEEFAEKCERALKSGVHLLVVDLFPPGPHNPKGIHGAIRQSINRGESTYDLPADEPLTLAAYAANGPRTEAYLEHLAVGGALAPMPLFLRYDRYVNVDLEETYEAAYRGLPKFWRDILEGRPPEIYTME